MAVATRPLWDRALADARRPAWWQWQQIAAVAARLLVGQRPRALVIAAARRCSADGLAGALRRAPFAVEVCSTDVLAGTEHISTRAICLCS